ncbi:hypothetical protein BKK55_02735 [Rodentibacter genomosp. 2]|uniref:Uncharacterized protein n=1 Tax=Rodentibacter genomosp. 2 TaxID=1908266 RepID=A0A1V3JPW4_9PAST|nr:hypothetical protein BKK55_02735 [Rodentibacter genomosp. 2]
MQQDIRDTQINPPVNLTLEQLNSLMNSRRFVMFNLKAPKGAFISSQFLKSNPPSLLLVLCSGGKGRTFIQSLRKGLGKNS